LGRAATLDYGAKNVYGRPDHGGRHESPQGPPEAGGLSLADTRDFTIAVVEAKAKYKSPGTGLQQAKDYAEVLGLKFAYATNGEGVVEFDYLNGLERELDSFPTPEELWSRLRGRQGLEEEAAERLLTPSHHLSGKSPRYYQEIAINRVVQAVLQEQRRILLTMATGTGKTLVAFQICWKLWNMRWNRTGEYRRPRILYLADRNVLVDDPKDKTFAPFGDARWKPALLRPQRSNGGGLVLRAAASQGPQELHQDQADALRGTRRLPIVVEGPRGERALLEGKRGGDPGERLQSRREEPALEGRAGAPAARGVGREHPRKGAAHSGDRGRNSANAGKVGALNNSFPLVPLSEVLSQNKSYIEAPEAKMYPKLSVKLYGKGVVPDTPVDGATLKMKRHQIASSGQVILSEIWGKKGAIGNCV
jgi:hypothetical protein